MSQNPTPFTYDFFLLCDENNARDIEFANKIKDYLEEEHNLKGYLDYQDGNAGQSIFANFENALMNSHFVILLISTESIKDGWWKIQMESSMFHHISRCSEKIIPLYLPDLNLDILPPSLTIYTGLYYNDDPNSNFWSKLARVFRH